MQDITVNTLMASYKKALNKMQKPYQKALDVSPDRIEPPTAYKNPPPTVPSASFYIYNRPKG